MTSSTPVLGAALALIAWRIVRRIRRNIGRQPLRPVRAALSITVFSALSVLLIVASARHSGLLFGIIGGLVPGAVLGLVGLRLTRFETTPGGHFYIPNTPIGVGVSVLMAGRLIYRFMVLRDVAAAPNHPPVMQSPLTFFIFGLMAGYYIVYQAGLFLHSRDLIGARRKSFELDGSNLDSACDRS